MNYEKIYNQIIARAKTRILDGYKERHHIIPKCMGGTNDKENLVDLTAREHFICHWILMRLYTDNHKLAYAFKAMCMLHNNRQLRYIPSSRSYQECKDHISRLGVLDETKTKISNSLKGHVRSKDSVAKGVATRLAKYPKQEKDVLIKRKKILSNEHKDNISKSLILAYQNGKTKYWLGKTSLRKGQTMSEDAKARISASKKGKPAHNKGKPLSEETKRKMSESKKLKKLENI